MLITNGTLLSLGDNPHVIHGGAVYIEEDTIIDVGSTAELTARHPHHEVLDAAGKIVMPGLTCGHTHFYGAFARGMAIPGEPPKSFIQILERLWWKVDRALTLEDCRFSALVALVDAIRHGTTTLIDHHASPDAIDGSLDAIAKAVDQAGVRASLCYEVTDRNREGEGVEENERWIRKCRDAGDGQMSALFGMHAPMTLVGLTALSVEIITIFSTPTRTASSAVRTGAAASCSRPDARSICSLTLKPQARSSSSTSHCVRAGSDEAYSTS